MKIRGIGQVRLQALIDAGLDSKEKLMEVPFYTVEKLPHFGYRTTCTLFHSLGREICYPGMIEITNSVPEDVLIENKVIKPWRVYKKTEEVPIQPDNFKCEKTTVWSFKDRGAWASHTPQYRGNWSPYIARNVIEMYSKPGDLVLDPMSGGGTTVVECMLTGRNSVACDINPGAISITRDRLNLPRDMMLTLPGTTHRTFVGDTRNLDLIADSSIDLIATHPPYVNIIKYAPTVPGDLSEIGDYSLFFVEFRKAIKEYFRVLKPGHFCAILIGDTHNKSHFVPVSTRMMIDFLREGFFLKEDIIKKEWNCESNRTVGKYANAGFLLTMHEHLYIFRKPNVGEKMKNSSIDFFNEE